MIFGFDRLTAAVLQSQNEIFMNELMNGGDVRSPQIQDHFKSLALFRNAEVVLFLMLPFIGFAVGQLRLSLQNFSIVVLLTSIGALLGRFIAKASPINFEMITILILSALGAFAIVICIQFFRRGSLDGGK